jgi:hypothetical protein
MQSTRIRGEDIVACEVRGQKFHALVEQEAHQDQVRKLRVLTLKPLTPGGHLPAYTVTPRQITDHWRKSGRRKGTTTE